MKSHEKEYEYDRGRVESPLNIPNIPCYPSFALAKTVSSCDGSSVVIRISSTP